MKFIRQLDLGENDISNLPGIIGDVNGTPDHKIVNPSDFNNFVPASWSPQQQQAYQQSQPQPSTGALNATDYYPTINHQIGVGSYGGSEIGNTTLFAPAGSVVPLAMMDARDAAVQRAALQKAKEHDDFLKNYQTPATKHTPVNDQLQQQYFEGLGQWRQNALKQAGGNSALANKILQNDPKFNAWHASAQSAAKQEDAVVDKIAQIHTDIKTGKWQSYPELDKAMQDVAEGYHGLGQSAFNPKGHNLNNALLKMNAEHDFATVANDAVQHMVKQQDAAAGINVNSPEYLSSSHTTDKYYSPEALAEMNKVIAPLVTHTMTPDESLKRLTAMYGAHEKTKGVTVSEKNKGGDNVVDFNDIESESSSFKTKVSMGTKGYTTSDGKVMEGADQSKGEFEEGNKVYRYGDIPTTHGFTFPKPLKINAPLNKNFHFQTGEAGGFSENNPGNKNMVFGKVDIAPVIDMPGTQFDGHPLTEQQLKDGYLNTKTGKKEPFKVRQEPLVHGYYEEEKAADEPGVHHDFTVPLKDVKNAITHTDKQGNKLTDEMFKRAQEENKKMKVAPPAKKEEVKEVKRKTKDGKVAIFDANTKQFLRYE